MPSCVIRWCKNNSCCQKKPCGITFHKFPTETRWKELWIKTIRKSRNEDNWLPSKYSVICSFHFEECDLYYTKCGLRRIMNNATPKKIVNPTTCTEIEESGVCAGQSMSDLKTEPVPQPSNKEKGIDTSNLYGYTLAEHTEDISMSRENATSELEVRDSDLESIFDTPEKSKLRQQVRKYKNRLQMHACKIKTLSQQVRQLKKKNASLMNVLKKLKEKRCIDTDCSALLNKNIVVADIFEKINFKKLSNG